VPYNFLAETCPVGLVTHPGSMDEASPRIARLIQTVAREVFAGSFVVEAM
jgi:hypothetical protein